MTERKFNLIIGSLFFGGLVLFIISLFIPPLKVGADIAPRYDSVYVTMEIPTIDFLLNKYNIKNQKVVKAQIALETGCMRSEFHKETNNLFSMMVAKTRPTTAIGVKGGYAIYRNVEESIIDYAFYQSRIRTRNITDDEYIKLLQEAGYAEDKEYSDKLKRMLK